MNTSAWSGYLGPALVTLVAGLVVADESKAQAVAKEIREEATRSNSDNAGPGGIQEPVTATASRRAGQGARDSSSPSLDVSTPCCVANKPVPFPFDRVLRREGLFTQPRRVE